MTTGFCIKIHLALTVSNSLLQSYLVVSFAQPFVSTGIETSARQLANAKVKYIWQVKAMAHLPDPANVKF